MDNHITHNEDTIYAPATIPGTGAITVIRVSGPEALSIADRVVTCNGTITNSKGYTIKFGRVIQNGGAVLDEVLVSVFHAPHSYTGENSVEISCHASSYIAGEIMSLLSEAGARAALPGEFTQRAFLNGKMDLTQAEAVADVISAQNATAHRIAFNQMKGGFSSELKTMRGELIDIVSLMELELDFSEEDVEFADRKRLSDLLDKTISHIERLCCSFRLGNAIKNGVPVAIVGATNAGKSTLLNALLGEERAIVSDIHGTTRDTIEEVLNVDGVLFRFIDTAGLREAADAVEKIGIERSYSTLHSAQIVLGVLDGTSSPEVLRHCAEQIISQVNLSEQKLWLVVNKCDLTTESSFFFKPAEPTESAELLTPAVLPELPKPADSSELLKTAESQEQPEIAESSELLKTVESHEQPEIAESSELLKTVESTELPDVAESTVNFFVSTLNNIVSFPKNKDIRIICMSAKTGRGLERLKNELASSQKDLIAGQTTTLVTNQRHYDALTSAATSLSRVKDGLASGVPTDLAAQDIREAIYTLGTIVGEISTDEILGTIFSHFCIGK